MSVSKGLVDVLLLNALYTHQRFDHVDFTSPLGQSEMLIVSRKNRLEGASQNFLVGIFDNLSYGLIAVSCLLMALYLMLERWSAQDALLTMVQLVFEKSSRLNSIFQSITRIT